MDDPYEHWVNVTVNIFGRDYISREFCLVNPLFWDIFTQNKFTFSKKRRKMPFTFSSAFNETEMKMEMKIQFQLSFFFAEKTKKEMSLKKNYLSQGYHLAFSEVGLAILPFFEGRRKYNNLRPVFEKHLMKFKKKFLGLFYFLGFGLFWNCLRPYLAFFIFLDLATLTWARGKGKCKCRRSNPQRFVAAKSRNAQNP